LTSTMGSLSDVSICLISFSAVEILSQL